MRISKKRCALLRSVLLTLCITGLAKRGEALEMRLVQDAMTIGYPYSGTPYGANAVLNVMPTSALGIRWTYLKFDLSALPDGTTSSMVGRAVLRLYVTSVTTAGSMDVAPVTSDWSEATIKGSLAPANGASEGSVAITTADSGKYIDIEVTDLVKDWISHTVTNYGIVLFPTASSPVSNLSMAMDSKESATTAHPPSLHIAINGGPKGDQGIPGIVGGVGPKGDKGDAGPATIRIAPSGDLSMGSYMSGATP